MSPIVALWDVFASIMVYVEATVPLFKIMKKTGLGTLRAIVLIQISRTRSVLSIVPVGESECLRKTFGQSVLMGWQTLQISELSFHIRMVSEGKPSSNGTQSGEFPYVRNHLDIEERY